MYFLDMMNFSVETERTIHIFFCIIMVLIFVILISLTIAAAKKAYGPSDDESGEKRSDVKFKVLIIIDCLFFLILTVIF